MGPAPHLHARRAYHGDRQCGGHVCSQL